VLAGPGDERDAQGDVEVRETASSGAWRHAGTRPGAGGVEPAGKTRDLTPGADAGASARASSSSRADPVSVPALSVP